ncbi:Ankyrin repeat family protein [Prunus dulcis]|uniref:Ankyrin repeat family protein n=1 Tax=Prunus dulcis TaxID=3755 RepID=A0A4Y1RGF0_PRUDU|nr:Ankyrin repeat family protein [Prunus dulcis]
MIEIGIKTLGFGRFEFGCRLSLDRISPIVRFQMSDLIRRGRTMTTAPSSDPPAHSASAATAPALMDHVVVGPGRPRACDLRHPWRSQLVLGGGTGPPTPSTRHRPTVLVPRDHSQEEEHPRTVSSAEDGEGHSGDQQSYQHRIRRAPSGCTTAELHSSLAHDIGHVVRTHCPMQWKSWRVMPDEIKAEVRGQLSTNYNLEDLDEESLTYVNRLFAERYKQWKSDLHHHFQAYDDPQVALQEGCPKELEGGRINKAQVNKGNRKKKTLLHHSGSRPFSYRMDARRGVQVPEIDVFGDVYVRPGNELAESLHTTMVERSQLVLQESASQLPPETPIESVAPPQDAEFQILTETLDQTLGRRPGTYCQGMGNARRREPRPRSSAQSNSQVTALTAHVASLENKLTAILQSLAQSGIPVPHLMRRPPSPSIPASHQTTTPVNAQTSEPVHPQHPHQTTAPVNAQTSDPILATTRLILIHYLISVFIFIINIYFIL